MGILHHDAQRSDVSSSRPGFHRQRAGLFRAVERFIGARDQTFRRFGPAEGGDPQTQGEAKGPAVLEVDLCTQRASALHGQIEVVHLKPEHDATSGAVQHSG